MRKIYFLFLFVLIASLGGIQAAEETIYVDLKETGLSGNSYSSGSFEQNNIKYEVSNIIPTKQQIRVNQSNASGNFYIYNTTAIPGAIKAVKLVNIGGDGIQERYACLATSESAISEPANGIAYGSSSNKVADIQWNVSNANDKFFNFYISGKSGGTVTLEGIEITYEAAAATELTAPVISGVVNGETYYGSALVNISYPDLATSMTYTITKDGSAGEPVTVNSAADLVIDEAGLYKIEATAFGEGDAQVEATPVEFTVVGNTEVASVADFLGKAASSEKPDEIYEFTCPLTVAYQYGADIYVRDAEGGALLIYDESRTYEGKYSMGDVIPAGATGKYDEYRGTYELIKATLGDATGTAEIEPVEMEMLKATKLHTTIASTLKSRLKLPTIM